MGLPYALALQWLHPGRPVFNPTGDGTFGFTIQELDTARRLKLPVINIVHNNACWGIVRHGQRMQLDFESAPRSPTPTTRRSRAASVAMAKP